MEQKLRLGKNGRKSKKCSVLCMKSMLKSFNALQLMGFGRNSHWQISLCQSESQTGFPASMSKKNGICASLMPAIGEKAVRKSLTTFSVPLLLGVCPWLEQKVGIGK